MEAWFLLILLVTMNPSTGPEFTNRFNLFRSAELTGIPAPGYTSTDAITCFTGSGRTSSSTGLGL